MGFNFEDLVNGVEGAISQAADAVSDAVDYVSDEVSDAVDYVSDEVSDAVDYVSDEVSDAVDYVSDKVSDAVDYVSDEVSDAVDYVSDEVSDAVLGAKAVVANACEDLECDAEEILAESHKLLVGACIATENEFNNIANFISYSNDLTEKAKEKSDEIERQANEQMIDAVKNKLNNIGEFIAYSNELNEQAKERSDEIERQANEQMIDAVKNKMSNIGEFISYSNELNEQAKERSDEIEQEGYIEMGNYVKNAYEQLRGEHIIPGFGYAGSASAGARKDASVTVVLDTENGDSDVLVAKGNGYTAQEMPSMGGSWVAMIAIADNGLSDLYEGGKTDGFTIGPFSIEKGTSEHATTYSISIGPKGTKVYEAHTSDTYTYSAKEEVKERVEQISEIKDDYLQYEIDQQTDQQTHTEKSSEQELKEKLYKQFDEKYFPDSKKN